MRRRCALFAFAVLGLVLSPAIDAGAQALPMATVTAGDDAWFVCPRPGFTSNIWLSPARFELTRSGESTEPLTVDLAWSGDTTVGQVVAPDSVTFAAGSNSETVTANYEPTASGELTLTVTEGAGYEPGDPASTTISVEVLNCGPQTPPPPPPRQSWTPASSVAANPALTG